MSKTVYFGRHEGLFERVNFMEFMHRQGAVGTVTRSKRHGAYSVIFGIRSDLVVSYKYLPYPEAYSPDQTTSVTIEGKDELIEGLERKIQEVATRFKIPSDEVGGTQ